MLELNKVSRKYEISGFDLNGLTENYGTPLYVYDASTISKQYHLLNNAFPGVRLRLHYACKANSNISIMKLLKEEGAGLDAVSIEEVQLGLYAGYEPSDIIYTPNSVDFAEISEAVKLGVRVNIDNLRILEQFGMHYGSAYPCCIRINPHIMAGGHAQISVGHIDSKFGISIHQMRHVLRLVESLQIRVEGLHMHTGSDILDAEVFLRGATLLFEAAFQFPDLAYLDFGSGFKVPYRENEEVTDIVETGRRISEVFTAFCREYGRELELKFEPGKFLVSEAGLLLVRANVVKQTTSTVFVGVNSGQNHLIRPMFYQAYHRIMNLSNPDGVRRLYSVVGYICETDTFAYDRKLHEVREGDLIGIFNAGAYGYAMANQYNSRLRPAEVLIKNGKAHLIRKRETIEDLLRNQLTSEA